MSSPQYQCLNCLNLGHCSETDVDKVIANYCCASWKEVQPEIYAARYKIVTLFGRQGVQAVIHKDLKDEED
jgi:hypothetical protein